MIIYNEWEEFFNGHAPVYMENSFTKNTAQEADFLVEVMGLPPGSEILDVGCGAGRHSVEMARRGYRMTGIDLSAGMLEEARKAAQAAGVFVEWLQADATHFQADRLYDGTFCLCEGAFGLIGMGEDPRLHDEAVLRAIGAAVKPGAPFVLTALNGWRKLRQFAQEDVDNGLFDPYTLVEICSMEYDTPEGKKSVRLRERSSLPGDLEALLESAGFEVLHLWGGTAGNWGRRPLLLDEIEMMAACRKKAD